MGLMKHENKKDTTKVSFLKNKWIIPFFCIVFFIFILSLRLLSDLDLGFHLNAGRWIMENMSFPGKDTFTFTANQNDYVDLHWLFQVTIYLLYSVVSYKGLSIFVALLSMVLLFLLVRRNYLLNVPLYFSCILLFVGFIIMEPRIVLRPEMFTFIFITLILFVLDNYYHRKIKQLFLLPILMIFWCNMHSLFILGFALSVAYFISIYFRDKKFDKYFFTWMIFSFAVCLINPYFIKGFTFPLELFTRFDSNNIYNQHIKEFKSFIQLDHFAAKDFLFIIFSIATILFTLITIKKRKLHEIILLVIFLYLALIGIRNIPLFIIIALPIFGSSLKEIIDSLKKKKNYKKFHWIKPLTFYLLIIIPLAFVFRLFTNSYYYSNESYYKTGIGIDAYQQPDNASTFILKNNLKGKILNSIGFGGWLEWRTHQPVFIDGRLEVMKEGLYNEVVESWNNGLPGIIEKYKPDLIIYNYFKYYPWINQIVELPEWKLIYLDGVSVVFARKNISSNIPEADLSALPTKYNLPENIDEQEIVRIISEEPSSKLKLWIQGFYQNTDFSNRNLLNIASVCLQLKQYKTAEKFFIEVLRKSHGSEKFIYYALAEIYKSSSDYEKEKICLLKILKFDPKNKTASASLLQLQNSPTDTVKTKPTNDNITNAKIYFNSGNQKFQNGDFEGALKDYNKAIELNPNYFKAYNNRGILKASELKKDEEALKDFNKAIEINPDYADAYLGRGTSKYNLKDTKGACEDWNKAANLGNTRALQQIEKYCH